MIIFGKGAKQSYVVQHVCDNRRQFYQKKDKKIQLNVEIWKIMTKFAFQTE